MKKLSDLYNIHKGKDIYIIGTGASFRVFPHSFFDHKITIGLNLAWQLIDVDYAITMVPHLNFPEFLNVPRPARTKWITKQDKYASHATSEMQTYADENYYYFRTDGQPSINGLDEPSEAGRVLDWVENPNDEFLYLWTSISQTAVNLAANMGGKNIILVGCDNCALFGNHHAHNQHTLWKGADPDDRYMQYYLGLKEVRSSLFKRQINVLSMSPFMKLDDPELDFRALCEAKGKAVYIENKEIQQIITLRQHNMRFLRLFLNILRKNFDYFFRALKKRLVNSRIN